MSSSDNNSSIKKIAAITGIIVSLIAIFTFITGFETLREIFASDQQDRSNSEFSQQPSLSPTNTAQPENVVPILSADYLFSDNFESGIKTDWFAIDGEWTMINDHLQGISGNPSRIGVGNSSWKNYTIEAKIGGLRNTVSSGKQFLETNPNIVFIGVRQNDDASTGYWFGITNWKQTCSYEKNNEKVIAFHSADNNIGTNEHTIKIEVSDNLFKLFIDGQSVCSFSDSNINQGIVVISTFPGTGEDPSYPWVDYIHIAEK